MIFISSFLVRLLTGKFASAIAVWPMIILKSPILLKDENLIRHEKIHLRQQAELLVVFFYIWYVLEFIYHYFKTLNRRRAYYLISFEREAYAQENNANYLRHRRFFAFTNYWKK